MRNKRRERKDIMLATPLDLNTVKTWPEPFIIQPKLDGYRCRAVMSDEGRLVALLSSTGRIIDSCPHIAFDIGEMGRRGLVPTVFDGELYKHDWSFQQISSVASRKEVNTDSLTMQMEFHIFDLVSSDPQVERIQRLKDIADRYFHPANSLRFVKSDLVTYEDLPEAIPKVMDSSPGDTPYEGVILRHPNVPYSDRRTTNMMKYKPRSEDEYLIIGFKEERSKDGIPKGRLGALLVMGDDDEEFSVGSGLTDTQRQTMWRNRERLIGQICTVKYEGYTDDLIPRFPVFVRVDEERTKTRKGPF